MKWPARLDLIVLVLMAIYSSAVVVHVYVGLARARTIDRTSKRTLGVVLNARVSSLKSIALTAPYLGLAGTCVGILSAFEAVAMERHAAFVLFTTRIGMSIVPTIVAIPVAVLGTCSYNYFRARLNKLENEVSEEVAPGRLHLRVASRFPLRKQFSKIPAFGLIAAWLLAILLRVYGIFTPLHTPKGFAVELASARCEFDGDGRIVVLRITETGRVFLNQEQESWKNLPDVLEKIYKNRKYRTLYLLADPDVPYQKVADAIDIAKDKEITVRLVTPKALNAKCAEPVAARRVFR